LKPQQCTPSQLIYIVHCSKALFSNLVFIVTKTNSAREMPSFIVLGINAKLRLLKY
jgi:hypothetical protein